jgi:3-methyladenine DNA glycosylase AlkC
MTIKGQKKAMPNGNKRVGARRRSEIPAETLVALNQGLIETANLVEVLAIDFALLMQRLSSKVPKSALKLIASSAGLGITKRMLLGGEILLEYLSFSAFETLQSHPTDTVRGWACFMVGLTPKLSLAKRLQLIRSLADDPHAGVREWAWMAIRPKVAKELDTAILRLSPWVLEGSDYLRRYATEITRPRGVWCNHIERLKEDPKIALPILNPLKSDQAKYVQNSVGNWLNDAAKSHPRWVQAHCKKWLKESDTLETAKICRRALRSLL